MSWFSRKHPDLKLAPKLQSALAQQREGHFDLLPKIIERLAEPHLAVLKAKRRQLRYKDDYGKVVDTAWRKEMEYFLSEHVRFPYYTLDGRDQASEHEFRLRFLDELVEGAEQQSAGEATPYHPSCSGVEFEQIVENIFEKLGGDVTRTPATGDQGLDLLVRFGDHKIGVQCKRSAGAVGNGAVQEAAAGRAYYDADEAWVVSDAPFTRSARQLADSLGVRLIDFRLIEENLT